MRCRSSGKSSTLSVRQPLYRRRCVVGYALMLSDYLGMSSQWGPATQEYWMGLQQRSAFLRSLILKNKLRLCKALIPPHPL